MAAPSKREVKSLEKVMAEQYNILLESLGRASAGVLGPAPGGRELTDDQELDRWDYQDPTVNIAQEIASGKDPLEVIRRAYPRRDRMITGGGRMTWKEYVEYAEQMARKSYERAQRNRAGAEGPEALFPGMMPEPAETVEPVEPAGPPPPLPTDMPAGQAVAPATAAPPAAAMPAPAPSPMSPEVQP